jgi:hypothetical protein
MFGTALNPPVLLAGTVPSLDIEITGAEFVEVAIGNIVGFRSTLLSIPYSDGDAPMHFCLFL